MKAKEFFYRWYAAAANRSYEGVRQAIPKPVLRGAHASLSKKCNQKVAFTYTVKNASSVTISPSMRNLRRIRTLLDLRLIDVSNATGIPEQKISLAERGLKSLSKTEEVLLFNFLRKRLSSADRGELHQHHSPGVHEFA